MVDEMSPVAFYVQLADLLAKQIEEEKLKPRQPVRVRASSNSSTASVAARSERRSACSGSVDWS